MIVYVDDPIAETVRTAISTAIEPFREPLGIEGEVVPAPEADFEGDPVIYIRMAHRLVEPHIVSAQIRAMYRAVSDAAWAAGERRFIHYRHDFAEQQSLDTHS